MKKSILCLLLLLLLVCSVALADGISLRARDIEVSKNRDRAVTNVLMLLQEDDVTRMVSVASLNTVTGRAVMISLDPALLVDIPEAGGEVPLSTVYSLGDSKSRGFLAMRTVNRLLDLNIGMYMAVDMSVIPTLVDAVESVWITPTPEEIKALGLEEDTWALNSEEVLSYMQLVLPEDGEGRNRSYEVMIQLLRQASGQDFMSMMGVGTTLLSAMDTNIGVMAAVSLGSGLKGGEHHIDLFLPQAEAVLEQDPLRADATLLQQKVTEVVYE